MRRPGEVQFGVLPGGPIVDGVTTVEAGLLARLDGTLSLEATYAEAVAAGITRRRWRELLALGARLGVVVDAEPAPSAGARFAGARFAGAPSAGAPSAGAPSANSASVQPQSRSAATGARRPPPTSVAAAGRGSIDEPGPDAVASRVVVDGAGPVSAEIAAVVARVCGATVAHERIDVDRAIADPLRERPDLVVLVGSPVVDPRRGNLWLRHGIPHLPVSAAGPHTTVGPLIDGSPLTPCLWCLDRHRTDRDEAWPTLMRQAAPAHPAGSADRVTTEGVEQGLAAGLAQLVAGTVALFVSRVLEGQLPSRGVSVEVSLPWPRMDHRRWPAHPLCPGHAVVTREDAPGAALPRRELPRGA
jgi:hypothetical protein